MNILAYNPYIRILMTVEDDYLDIAYTLLKISHMKQGIDVDVLEREDNVYHIFYLV